jgi:hypothetical protein
MSPERETTALFVLVDKGQVDAVRKLLGDLPTQIIESIDLWGERGITIGRDGERGHLAAMKDLYPESGPPADSDF